VAARPQIAIGFLGTQLDQGQGAGRWEKWRPTVSLGQQPDLELARIELLVDFDRSGGLARRVVDDLRQVAPRTQVRLHDVRLADPWDFEEVYAALHDFLRGYAFDPEREDYLLHITTGTHVVQICWFLLAEARFAPARLLQTAPPRRQDGRSAGTWSVIDLDLARYDRIAQRFRRDQADTASFLKSGIETRNAAFNRMIEQIERVAVRTRAPILLVGPTGAGKSMLAKNIFALKKQRHALEGAFVEVNCATIRGDGAGSALFGHVRGAYTGAAGERAGLLRSADKGLLFLDEIGELGLDEQAMLLRAIEDRRFLPVGGDREVGSDFQLITGTNRDLAQAVGEGRFREDLFARLNLWTFALPGLRERPEDIEPNIDFELERFARLNDERVGFNTEARQRYLRFATGPDATWSGNFRDLSASVTRMATLARAGRIDAAVVDEEIARLRRAWARGGTRDGAQVAESVLGEVLPPEALAAIDRFDRSQLADVVRVCRSTRSLSEAGRVLFQASRERRSSVNDADRLRKYLRRFGLDWDALTGP
jgi:transcriptional regulatory protein RtcR